MRGSEIVTHWSFIEQQKCDGNEREKLLSFFMNYYYFAQTDKKNGGNGKMLPVASLSNVPKILT